MFAQTAHGASTADWRCKFSSLISLSKTALSDRPRVRRGQNDGAAEPADRDEEAEHFRQARSHVRQVPVGTEQKPGFGEQSKLDLERATAVHH